MYVNCVYVCSIYVRMQNNRPLYDFKKSKGKEIKGGKNRKKEFFGKIKVFAVPNHKN